MANQEIKELIEKIRQNPQDFVMTAKERQVVIKDREVADKRIQASDRKLILIRE